MTKPKFKIGDKVYKPKGYKFNSVVVSVFKTTNRETRIVAENQDGILHIMSEQQLKKTNPKSGEAKILPTKAKIP